MRVQKLCQNYQSPQNRSKGQSFGFSVTKRPQVKSFVTIRLGESNPGAVVEKSLDEIFASNPTLAERFEQVTTWFKGKGADVELIAEKVPDSGEKVEISFSLKPLKISSEHRLFEQINLATATEKDLQRVADEAITNYEAIPAYSKPGYPWPPLRNQ